MSQTSERNSPNPHGAQPALESDRLLRTLIDNMPAMIGYWDRNLRNVLGNEAYVEWFGMTPDQMVGLHIREVIGEDLFVKNFPYMEAALAGERQMFDREIVDAAGRTRYSQAYYVPDEDESGQVKGFFVLVVDVTERVDAETRLAEAHTEMARRATSDPLTGLANRTLLSERLDAALAASSRSGRQVGLLMIDLDRFKPINDDYGHAAGDMMLVAVATRLRSVVRETDLVARIGGDEFVILSPEVADYAEATTLADRVVEALGGDLVLAHDDESIIIRIGGSLGVAVTGRGDVDEATSGPELMREADRKMYEAKQAGGGRWHGVGPGSG